MDEIDKIFRHAVPYAGYGAIQAVTSAEWDVRAAKCQTLCEGRAHHAGRRLLLVANAHDQSGFGHLSRLHQHGLHASPS
jgi:hypothetical protein